MQRNPEPTVETVKGGLVKLLREIQQLKTEVSALKQIISDFAGKRVIRQPPLSHAGYDIGHSPETYEPQSHAQWLLHEIYRSKDHKDLELTSKAILAMAADLDGALRDVRAARADIEAITNDSDLRAQLRNRRRK